MEDSREVLRSLACSRLRQDILSSLERPMRLSDLKRAVDSNAPNTSAKARELQKMGFVCRERGDYRITDAGKIVFEKLSLLSDAIEAYHKHRAFWIKTFDKLPKEIKWQIEKFKDAELIQNERDNLRKVESTISKLLSSARGELLVLMPSKSQELLKALEGRLGITLVTSREDPELGYGLIVSDDFTIIFTELLDMALIAKKSISFSYN